MKCDTPSAVHCSHKHTAQWTAPDGKTTGAGSSVPVPRRSTRTPPTSAMRAHTSIAVKETCGGGRGRGSPCHGVPHPTPPNRCTVCREHDCVGRCGCCALRGMGVFEATGAVAHLFAGRRWLAKSWDFLFVGGRAAANGASRAVFVGASRDGASQGGVFDATLSDQ